MALAMWRSFLAGNFKTSLIRRKPLLIPSLVFIITILVVPVIIPLPMSAYRGPNLVRDHQTMSAQFDVFETDVYESNIEFRVALGLEINTYERIEVFANFSQDGVVVRSLFINMTPDSLDENHGVSQSISLDAGLYHVSVITNYYFNDILQDPAYTIILVNQPVVSAFILELTAWASYQFILGACCIFLFLGGICIGREEKTRWSREPIDQEPPREERYPSKFRRYGSQ
jgi:hypothetical protein